MISMSLYPLHFHSLYALPSTYHNFYGPISPDCPQSQWSCPSYLPPIFYGLILPFCSQPLWPHLGHLPTDTMAPSITPTNDSMARPASPATAYIVPSIISISPAHRI